MGLDYISQIPLGLENISQLPLQIEHISQPPLLLDNFSVLQELTKVSLVVQAVKNLPAMWETGFRSLVWEDPWRRKWQPTPVFLPREFMDRGAWWTTVRGVVKSQVNERLTLPLFIRFRSTAK